MNYGSESLPRAPQAAFHSRAPGSRDAPEGMLHMHDPMQLPRHLEQLDPEFLPPGVLQDSIAKLLANAGFTDGEGECSFQMLYDYFRHNPTGASPSFLAPERTPLAWRREACIVLSDLSFRHFSPEADPMYISPDRVLIAGKLADGAAQTSAAEDLSTAAVDRLIRMLGRCEETDSAYWWQIVAPDDALGYLNDNAGTVVTLTLPDHLWLENECVLGGLEIPLPQVHSLFIDPMRLGGPRLRTIPPQGIDARLEAALRKMTEQPNNYIADAAAMLPPSARQVLPGAGKDAAPQHTDAPHWDRLVADVFLSALLKGEPSR